MSILSVILDRIGVGAVEKFLSDKIGLQGLSTLVEQTLVSEAKSMGHDAVERAVTMPEAAVRSICAKTGADPVTVLALRDKAALAEADFLMAFYPTPPDPAGVVGPVEP